MSEAHYKMGAVVRLTGIPANTLRTWERRYGAVSPDRSSGGARMYREEDITRLQLISALLENGDAIGAVANLSVDGLRERLATHGGKVPTIQSTDAISVAVLGQGLAAQLRATPDQLPVDLNVAFDGGGADEFLARPVRVDAMLIHLKALGRAPISVFRELMLASGARLGIVVYDYSQTSTLWKLSDAGARLVRGPTRVASMIQLISDQLSVDRARAAATAAPVVGIAEEVRPERHFSTAQLGWLKEARNGIECECPNHLSSLVEALNAFEDYSLDCENRNEDDALLHQALATGCARARSILETLLQQIIEADNLIVPE